MNKHTEFVIDWLNSEAVNNCDDVKFLVEWEIKDSYSELKSDILNHAKEQIEWDEVYNYCQKVRKQ